MLQLDIVQIKAKPSECMPLPALAATAQQHASSYCGNVSLADMQLMAHSAGVFACPLQSSSAWQQLQHYLAWDYDTNMVSRDQALQKQA